MLRKAVTDLPFRPLARVSLYRTRNHHPKGAAEGCERDNRITHSVIGKCLLPDSQVTSLCVTVRVAVQLSWPGDDLSIPAKILVVDDQQYVRQTLCALLMRQSHWKVYEAADGHAAVARARDVQPDVVVLDLVMPEMNGLAVAYELRRLSPQTKIILISSHYVKEEAAYLLRLLGDGNFVPKSEIAKQLVPAINSLLSEESQAH